jgi:hypothetical protein
VTEPSGFVVEPSELRTPAGFAAGAAGADFLQPPRPKGKIVRLARVRVAARLRGVLISVVLQLAYISVMVRVAARVVPANSFIPHRNFFSYNIPPEAEFKQGKARESVREAERKLQ